MVSQTCPLEVKSESDDDDDAEDDDDDLDFHSDTSNITSTNDIVLCVIFFNKDRK